jgi:murein L,D-transpeptidase YafK
MRPFFLFFTFVFGHYIFGQTSFIEQQLRFDRVAVAQAHTNDRIEKLFRDSGLQSPRYICWQSFKLEDELELWAADSAKGPYKKLKTYKICKGSGNLGPKRKYGDGQVPEGFYYFNFYNPNSNYYLSIKISYPNESDLILGNQENPGGDIYLHGACASIGCIPMTDSLVEEIYWITVLAQNYQGVTAKIPIHIFPCHFNAKNWDYLHAMYSQRPALIAFWKDLDKIYRYFHLQKYIPTIVVDNAGKYKIEIDQKSHLTDPNH